jgi:hypothetical protein
LLLYRDTKLGSFTARVSKAQAGYCLEPRRAGAVKDIDEPDTAWPDEIAPLRRYADVKEPARLWLVEKPPQGGKRFVERVAPLGRGHHGLLETFVGLRTEAQARNFANRYGLLEGGSEEPVSFWAHHVRELLGLVTVFDLIESGDRDALSGVVVWRADPLVFAVHPGVAVGRVLKSERAPAPLLDLARWAPRWRLYTEHNNPTLFRTPKGQLRWRPGEVFGPAQAYLCDILNKQVRSKVHPKLMQFARRQGKGIPLDFEADTLLASLYLWLQLKVSEYEALRGEQVDRRDCQRPGCKNQFEARGNSKVCGDEACRKWLRQQRNLKYNLNKRQASR